MSYHPAEANAPLRLGRYELLGQLATGGMAEIHLARLAGEAGFEKIVVVKRLLPELVASKAFVTMFLDEGRLVARLDHPNVCEVYELGRDGAEYFLVMPYLDGVPASDFIARPREPDRMAQLRVAAGIVVQACAGLHHAHERLAGLVHRDVSPSNVFVTTAGVVKVLDFGIAKVHGAAETEAGTIKGKTQYMAPEQVLGEALDRRCDVFALGIVLYELCTHQRLFKRSSDYLTARAILEEPIPRADAVDPAVPAALADVIAKALARDRAARYADAEEMGAAIAAAIAPASNSEIAAALADWHGEQLTALRTRRASVLRTSGEPGSAAGSQVATVALAPRRARWPVAALALLVVAGGGVALYEVMGAREGSPVAPQTATATAPAPVTGSGSGSGSGSVAVADAASVTATATDAGAASPPPAPPHVHVAHKHGTGTFSIDSNPYATIFVDGKELGITPLLDKALPAGRHRIRAVLHDGRSKDLNIDIPSGKPLAPITLDRW